jgi:hypothetical protein
MILATSQRITAGIEQHEVTPGLLEHYNGERESSSVQKQTLVTLLIIIPSEWYMAVLQVPRSLTNRKDPDAFLLLF